MSIKTENAKQIDEITTMPAVGRELASRKISLADIDCKCAEDVIAFVEGVRVLAHKLNDEAGADRYEGGICYRDAAIAQITGTKSPISN